MRLLIRLLTALALVSPIAGGALPAAAQDKVRLLLDWFVNPDHAALVIAKQRGIFTKHGLDVELIAPADPNAPPKLVAAGQAEYAVSYQPTLQMLVAEGLPLVRVGVLVAQPLNSLVALEDGPVKSIADFKGRKIGYSIAGFEEALLGAILEKAGLTLKDVTLININFALDHGADEQAGRRRDRRLPQFRAERPCPAQGQGPPVGGREERRADL